jgi:hypothetical protein
MAFRFKTIGQEINVWFTLSERYNYEGPNKAFFDAISSKRTVELNDGLATLVAKSDGNRYEGDPWVVFEYKGDKWRMDLDEYDSWEQGEEPTEPYKVEAKPVEEIQYVRVK